MHAFLDLKTQDFFFPPKTLKHSIYKKDKQPVTLALNYLTHYLFVARIVYYFSLLLLLLCGLFARKYSVLYSKFTTDITKTKCRLYSSMQLLD